LEKRIKYITVEYKTEERGIFRGTVGVIRARTTTGIGRGPKSRKKPSGGVFGGGKKQKDLDQEDCWKDGGPTTSPGFLSEKARKERAKRVKSRNNCYVWAKREKKKRIVQGSTRTKLGRGPYSGCGGRGP